MAKFEFKKNIVKLNISGHCFEVPLTNEVIIACDRLKYDASGFVNSLSEAHDAETAKETLVRTCDFLAEGIDDILGSGSVKEIYGENLVSLLDLVDIVVYIRSSIMKAIESKTKEYEEANK